MGDISSYRSSNWKYNFKISTSFFSKFTTTLFVMYNFFYWIVNWLLFLCPRALFSTESLRTLICFLQMNYEDFCHIASVCTEQIGPKCRRFFSPSNFMKFEKDEQGRIAILPFYLYVMRTVGHFQLELIFWRFCLILMDTCGSVFVLFLHWILFSCLFLPNELDECIKCLCLSKISNDFGCTGFTYTSKNWYEWAWWGFWWFPSATCMVFIFIFNFFISARFPFV